MAEVAIVPDADAGGRLAASLIARLVARSPRAVLGVATGSTPLTTYRALADMDLDLGGVSAFALDEYVGLEAGHPQSYRAVIDREVTAALGLRPEGVHVPGSELGAGADAAALDRAGAHYERAIADAGGIDLQLLGIGATGHIGFNEPGSSLASRTRVKTLMRQTRLDNSRFFGSVDEVPKHCITQGLGTILEARHLVLLAFGERKAQAVAAALEGPVSASVPGSVVQLHPHVTAIVDEAAARALRFADYYRDAFEGSITGA